MSEHNTTPIRCEVHGCNIVDQFPADCAMNWANSLWAVHEHRKEGFRKLCATPPDPSGNIDLARYATCYECVTVKAMGNQIVRCLRRQVLDEDREDQRERARKGNQPGASPENLPDMNTGDTRDHLAKRSRPTVTLAWGAPK